MIGPLTLHYHGWHSKETRLVDETGRNFLEVLPVTALRLIAPPPRRGADQFDREQDHLVLELFVGRGFTVNGLRARVDESDLQAIAAAHGFDLVRKPHAAAGDPPPKR